MQKIQMVSRFFHYLFIVILVAWVAAYFYRWFLMPVDLVIGQKPSPYLHFSLIPDGVKVLHPITYSTRFWGFLVSLIPLAVKLYIITSLIQLFKLYEKGKIFTDKNVFHIKMIAYLLLAVQLIRPVHEAFLTMILTWHNPVGHRMAVASMTGTNIGLMLTALVILLVAWIMGEAKKLKEEQELTV